MKPELLALLPHTINVMPFSSWDAYGNAVYQSGIWPSGINYQGRARNVSHDVINERGELITAKTEVLLATISGISNEDRMTLPSGFTPNQPPIIRVERISDENGLSHTRIYCGGAKVNRT